jgi:hypothetical protein
VCVKSKRKHLADYVILQSAGDCGNIWDKKIKTSGL